jgi:hypothetical protein
VTCENSSSNTAASGMPPANFISAEVPDHGDCHACPPDEADAR